MAKEIKVGQVYRDKDKRMSGGNRYLLVMGIVRNKWQLVSCSPDGTRYSYLGSSEPSTRVSDKGLQTRFELVEDVEPTS
jgi:hypothetical protein